MGYKHFTHMQNKEFLRDLCGLSGQTLFDVGGYCVLARKKPLFGYVNAYLYSPETIRPFTNEDANVLQNWLRTENIGSAFIYSTHYMDHLPLIETKGGTFFLDLARTEKELWDNLESRCRTAINKSVKNGLYVDCDNGEKYFNEWYSVYCRLAETRAFSFQDEHVLLGLMKKGWGRLFTVHQGKAMLGGMYCILADYAVPFAASISVTPEARKLSPGNILWWEIIRYYKRQGVAVFDFMGANDDPNHGPTKFKRSFGGEFVRNYHYRLVGSKSKHFLYSLVERCRKS